MFKEKDKANRLLRYLIRVSEGYGFKAPIRVRFGVLLSIKEELEEMGAIWQVERAKNWINLFVRRHKNDLRSKTDPRAEGEGGVSPSDDRYLKKLYRENKKLGLDRGEL